MKAVDHASIARELPKCNQPFAIFEQQFVIDQRTTFVYKSLKPGHIVLLALVTMGKAHVRPVRNDPVYRNLFNS